jgi:hypothetical protein
MAAKAGNLNGRVLQHLPTVSAHSVHHQEEQDVMASEVNNHPRHGWKTRSPLSAERKPHLNSQQYTALIC